MDRDSWSRNRWDSDPRFAENVVIARNSLQNLVRTAADLQTRLDAAQQLLLRRGIPAVEIDPRAAA